MAFESGEEKSLLPERMMCFRRGYIVFDMFKNTWMTGEM